MQSRISATGKCMPHLGHLCRKEILMVQYLSTGTVATVRRISTGWIVPGSTAGGDEIFRRLQLGPEAYLVFCTMVTDSLPAIKRPKRGTKIVVPRIRMGCSCTSGYTGMSWLTFTNQYRLMLFRFASSSVSQYNKIVQVFQVRSF